MSDPAPAVLLVHGLWMTGFESTFLRHRLAALGFNARQFHYHSTTETPHAVVQRLRMEIVALAELAPVHLIGHSLGGLIVLRALERHRTLPVVRSVLLGSPVNGSRAARAFVDLPGAGWFMGGVAKDELLHASARRFEGPGELGVIAGTSSLGLGRIIGPLAEPNDGTVAVEETTLDGATAFCALPVSHLGMLLSAEVADEAALFLRTGRFGAGTVSP